MNKLIPTLLAALILPMASMNVYAEKLCNRGDTRCTADGYVQECVFGLTSDSTDWFTYAGKKCADRASVTETRCTEGDQKCGADGYIMKCTSQNKWRSTYVQCKK